MTGPDITRLEEVLAKESALLDRFLSLAQEQSVLIEADNTDSLSKNFEAREKIIEKHKGLYQERELLMQTYNSQKGNISSGICGKIDILYAHIQETLRAISELDDKNRSSIQAKMDQFRSSTKQLSLSRKSIHTYNSLGGPCGSGLFDRKS